MVKNSLGRHQYPREIEFVAGLPKTVRDRQDPALHAPRAHEFEETHASLQPIVPKNWPERLTFSPAVRVGNLVFLSGTTATDEQGNIVGLGDIVAQTRQIFHKFSQILKAKAAASPISWRRRTTCFRSTTTRRQPSSVANCSGAALASSDRGGSQRPRPDGCANRD